MNSDFILRFRRTFNDIKAISEKDYNKLLKLSGCLIQEIDLEINTPHPIADIRFRKLVSTLRECIAERDKTRPYVDSLGIGIDPYNSNWEDVVNCFEMIEYTIGELYILLAEYYPEHLKNKDIRKEVKAAIPRFHSLGSMVKAKISFIESQEAVTQIKATHREHALAHHYKVKARLASDLTREEMKKAGKNREIAFDSLHIKSKTYAPPKEKELKNVIQLLTEHPEAQQMVINDLDHLQNS